MQEDPPSAGGSRRPPWQPGVSSGYEEQRGVKEGQREQFLSVSLMCIRTVMTLKTHGQAKFSHNSDAQW